MANLFSLPTRFLALLGAGLLLSGCCANNECPCEDADIDVVELRFTRGFAPSELDTVAIERYPVPLPVGGKPETVVLIRPAAQAYDAIRLNNNTPFAQIGTTKLDGYRYVLRYYAAQPGRKSVLTTLYNINAINLKGSLDSDGCCACYTNASKTVAARREGAAQDSIFDLKQLDLKQPPKFLRISK